MGGERYSIMNFEVILTETISLTDVLSVIVRVIIGN